MIPARHEQATGERPTLGGGRAAAAAGAAQAEGRPAARAGPGRAERDHLRAEDRHPVGGAPARDGLRQRGDLLAAAARLAAGRGLAPPAHGAAGAARPGRAARLEPREPGQRERAGQKGGAETGPNPTDRAKAGTKVHLLVDRRGVPLSVWHTPANDHDSALFEALLELVEPIPGPRGRPRARPAKLHADKAYDNRRCRGYLRARRIGDRIARIGIDSSTKLGRHRWVVERALAWLFQFRRLATRYERRDDIHLALLDLACALICFRTLHPRF
jgi:transposase